MKINDFLGEGGGGTNDLKTIYLPLVLAVKQIFFIPPARYVKLELNGLITIFLNLINSKDGLSTLYTN